MQLHPSGNKQLRTSLPGLWTRSARIIFFRLITSGDCALTVWCESSSSCSQSDIELIYFFILFSCSRGLTNLCVQQSTFPSLYWCKINLWSRKCDKTVQSLDGWMDGWILTTISSVFPEAWLERHPTWLTSQHFSVNKASNEKHLPALRSSLSADTQVATCCQRFKF